jgi:hypothetical protein
VVKVAMRKIGRVAVALLFACAAYLVVVYAVVALSPEIHWGDSALPAHLKGKAHDDYWLPGTRWVPRSATSMRLVEPPVMVLGSDGHPSAAGLDGARGPKPIPPPGQWQASLVQVKAGWPLVLPYVALTTSEGLHFRFGARWDDVDHYYTFPTFALYRFDVR